MFFSFRSGNPLFDLGEIYVLILFARALLSWFPYNPTSPLNPVRRVVFAEVKQRVTGTEGEEH